MSRCISFKQIVSAKAYKLNEATTDIPFGVFMPEIKSEDLTISGEGIKLRIKDDAELKVTSKSDVPGDSFTNVFSYEEDTPNNIKDSQIKELKQYPHHLIIECLGGGTYFIRASKDTYICNFSETDGKREVEITITNISGAQRILPYE